MIHIHQHLDVYVGGKRVTVPALIGKLRAITPPAADSAVINRYLSGVSSQTGLINQLADAIKAHDTKAITTLGTKIQQGAAVVQGVAKTYGFKVCGSS